MNLRVNIQIC